MDTNQVNSDVNPINSPINHIVVLYLENRSFDGLYGNFPGADGLTNAGDAATQVDKNGVPYTTLPPILNSNNGFAVDPRFPTDLPNAPFEINHYVSLEDKTGDMVHRYYQEQKQINGGKMNQFVAYGDAGGLTMGHYDTSNLDLYQLARQYTLNDQFFHSAFGGSFLNHMFLVAADAPTWPNAPSSLVAQLDADGNLIKDGQVTPDGYAVNTSQPFYTPFAAGTPVENRVPPQTIPTIGDRLSEKGISWAWYSGGWDDAIAGNPDPLFQFHHQPLAYFANYGDGTPGRAAHLKDESEFIAAIENNTLPSVSFVKPIGEENQHPGYTDIATGDRWAADIIEKIQNSPAWKDTVIIVAYDENGGMWDHAAPPVVDKWGPGTRIPNIIISPYALKGTVDSTTLETTSILKFIETRYALDPLTQHDAEANDLLSSFDFNQNVINGADTEANLYGTSGNDLIFAGAGDTSVFGNGGNDSIYGGAGNDKLYGGSGNDFLDGRAGDDILYSNGGNNILLGGDGNDIIYGSGNDYINGGRGNDLIYGNGGDDTIFGDAGNDIIYVGSGKNLINPGTGDDEIWLNGGEDTIILSRTNGTDIIHNYQAGRTTIGLSDGLKFEDLTITTDGGAALISAGNRTLASLNWVQADTLTKSSFINVG